jgi:hypothetical protein
MNKSVFDLRSNDNFENTLSAQSVNLIKNISHSLTFFNLKMRLSHASRML